MGALNVQNRTLAIMDNLPFLRSINNECIDLIAIDPPFAANETFRQNPKPPITDDELAEERALARKHGVEHHEGIGETRVKDVWSWDADIHPGWKERIEDDYPQVFKVIEAVEACASENEAAYVCYMAVRLIECHRVLKPTGSLYIHCDDHANSYLRMLLDAIFAASNFRHEIIWQLPAASGFKSLANKFIRGHDTILHYSKSNKSNFNKEYLPYSQDQLKRFTGVDEDGRRYKTITKSRRLYLDEAKGVPITDVWMDIASFQTIVNSPEITGYATQKPLALYERIIKASSNPGDVVMDIFAGCATTAVAAERLERKWIACDMAYRSWTMLKRRFYLNGIALQETTDSTKNALASVKKDKGFQEPQQWTTSYIIGPNELPQRTDSDPVPYHHLPRGRRGQRTIQSATWSGRISKEEAKKLLIERFGPVCWGCGYEPRRPNGSLDDTLLEVDHIRARRASEGTQGDDELYNLALLHRTCNGIKRNKLTLEELRKDNALNARLYVDNLGQLVDLFEAQQFAMEKIAHHVATHGYQPSMTELRLVAESPGD